MTIENTLDRIATALEQIAARHAVTTHVSAPLTTLVPQPQAPQSPPQPQAPVQQAPVPVPVPAPVPAPQGQPAYPKSPLTDGNSVMAYCIEKYKTLGPVKGGEIQSILAALGHTNVATLRVDQYDEFYFRVEGL